MNVPHVILDPMSYTAWGSAEEVTAPASNLGDIERPDIVSRQLTSGGRWYLQLDVTAAVTGMLLVNCNFGSADVFYSTDGGYTFTGTLSNAPMLLDPRTGRTSAYLKPTCPNGTTTVLVVAGAITTGDPFFQLGSAAIGTDHPLASLPSWPVRFAPVTPSSELTQPNTGRLVDVNEEGKVFVTLRLAGQFDLNGASSVTAAILADLQAIAARPASDAFVYWDGDDWPERAYVVKRSEDATIRQEAGVVIADIGLRECV